MRGGRGGFGYSGRGDQVFHPQGGQDSLGPGHALLRQPQGNAALGILEQPLGFQVLQNLKVIPLPAPAAGGVVMVLEGGEIEQSQGQFLELLWGSVHGKPPFFWRKGTRPFLKKRRV